MFITFSGAEILPGKGEVEILLRTPPAPHRCCGADSLYVCCKNMGLGGIQLTEVEKLLPLGPQGVSINDISKASGFLGVPTTKVRVDPGDLLSLPSPAILHVNKDHFISFLGNRDGKPLVFDNTLGLLLYPSQEGFQKDYKWDGAAVLFVPIGRFDWPSWVSLTLGIGCVVLLLNLTIKHFVAGLDSGGENEKTSSNP